MHPKLPHQMAILVLAGRTVAAILALAAVLSKPLENALFTCVVLGAVWFFVEGGINLWQQHQDALARKLRDDELKRQRAEEARLRFEASQRERQADADASYMDLDLDDVTVSDAKIPLGDLMHAGVQNAAGQSRQNRESASPTAAGGMSTAELDLALITMDAEAASGRPSRPSMQGRSA